MSELPLPEELATPATKMNFLVHRVTPTKVLRTAHTFAPELFSASQLVEKLVGKSDGVIGMGLEEIEAILIENNYQCYIVNASGERLFYEVDFESEATRWHDRPQFDIERFKVVIKGLVGTTMMDTQKDEKIAEDLLLRTIKEVAIATFNDRRKY